MAFESIASLPSHQRKPGEAVSVSLGWFVPGFFHLRIDELNLFVGRGRQAEILRNIACDLGRSAGRLGHDICLVS
ncbi:MAG TPA: hypothetical protein VGQ75_07835 [Thermoanaerobaculia bacterium]|jgi:hypothetical protein|nr:hypothetical protein [Thermoanaerobaculia bacterium]